MTLKEISLAAEANCLADAEPEEGAGATISATLQTTEVGALLRTLRGPRSLRQLGNDTGIAYSYLSDIERGTKHPGYNVLTRLAAYHRVPLDRLLDAAGIEKKPNWNRDLSNAEIQRTFRFVVEDPEFETLLKPEESDPIDMQQFVVRLYEHYTGKKLLD